MVQKLKLRICNQDSINGKTWGTIAFSFLNKINEFINHCFINCLYLANTKICMECWRGDQRTKRKKSRFKYQKLRNAWKKTWTFFKVKIQKPNVLHCGWWKLLLLLVLWKENFLLMDKTSNKLLGLWKEALQHFT